MKDFTLYLNFIDSNRFSKEQSRFGLALFKDEWKMAWQSYENHVSNAAAWLPIEVSEYALAGWRQDLREKLCIRKKPVTALEFSAIERAAVININNPVLGKDFVLRYEQIIDLSWRESEASEAADCELFSQEIVRDLPIIYVEELRFPKKGVIEHEILFLEGSRLLITAASLTLNLSHYMGRAHK